MTTAEPKYKIEKIEFDGPLSLLLGLLRRDRVDICDIPIASIAEQYLDFVAELPETDPEIISSFVVMAATLMDIKARMLLPGERAEDSEDIDPREELIARLEAYEGIREAAQRLRAMEQEASRFIYSRGALPEELRADSSGADISLILEGIDRDALSRLYDELMSRARLARNDRAMDFSVIRRDRASLVRYIGQLTRYASTHERFRFSELHCARTDEVVVQFLALLELTRMGRVGVRQKGSDIAVEVIDREGLAAGELAGVLEL